MSTEASEAQPQPAAADDAASAAVITDFREDPQMPGFHETGWLRIFILCLGVGISLLHLYFNVLTLLPTLWQNALHFAGFALLCVCIYPLGKPGSRHIRWTVVLDVLLGLAAAISAIYLISQEDIIYDRGVRLSDMDWVACFVLIGSALELTRRTTGWIIPVLIVLALTYVAWWGKYVPGVFNFPGLSTETVLFRSVFGDDGLFGSIALISSSFVFMFILFGAFLMRSGGGDFIIDLARVLAGRTTGGPGFVAVIASALTGTISGSAVANSASTGVITIPLMKKAGFPAKFAAGVEAAASTGGQLMPPIMGAGAFVMASYTQIPYTTIVAVSVLPALLYFASVAFYVRIEARRSDVRPAEEDGDTPTLMGVMKQGGFAFLVPIIALIGLLIWGFTPTYAAGISIIAVVVASWLTPNRMGPKAIIEAMALGARNMTMTAILLCSVGLIVNVIATAGIGNTFSLMITNWAGSSLMIAIVLIALASLVLGMGLPVTAAYIVLGTLSAPALYALIADNLVIDAIVQGSLPETVRAVMMLSLPDAMTKLAQPMALADAQALYASIPIDLKGTVRDMTLDPAAATSAMLAAHLIIFWLSQDSNVTPPVCLTAFTVAAIAKTPPMATGMTSWKIAKGLYIMPLLFAYTPILSGDWALALEISFFALFGIYALTAVVAGYMEARLSLLYRALLLVAGLLCLWPLPWWGHVPGIALLALVFFLHRRGTDAGVQTATPAAG